MIVLTGDDSGEDSGDEQDRREQDDEEDGDRNAPDSPVCRFPVVRIYPC